MMALPMPDCLSMSAESGGRDWSHRVTLSRILTAGSERSGMGASQSVRAGVRGKIYFDKYFSKIFLPIVAMIGPSRNLIRWMDAKAKMNRIYIFIDELSCLSQTHLQAEK